MMTEEVAALSSLPNPTNPPSHPYTLHPTPKKVKTKTINNLQVQRATLLCDQPITEDAPDAPDASSSEMTPSRNKLLPVMPVIGVRKSVTRSLGLTYLGRRATGGDRATAPTSSGQKKQLMSCLGMGAGGDVGWLMSEVWLVWLGLGWLVRWTK